MVLLRGWQLDAKFRRQCQIEDWMVDFYCFEHRLAIELDGAVHSQPSQRRRDATKEAYLRSIGVRLLWVPNGLVLEDPEGFVRHMREQMAVAGDRAKQLTPHPARYARHPLPRERAVLLRKKRGQKT
jgi:very-short-patch-repair endonuclease